MKKTVFNVFVVFLLVPAIALAGNKWKGKHTKEKKISKEFNVLAPDALLKVDNSYGNLYITSWDEDRIVIDVTIKVNGNDEKKVQKRLDAIDVEFEFSRVLVAAKTTFGSTKNWRGNNVNMEINYTIKVPITNNVELKNNYGSISLDKLRGKASIKCNYGKLDIGELLADENTLSFDYTTSSTIDYMKSGAIHADYSSFTLDAVENLSLKADYTNSAIEKVNAIEYSCDYGKLAIEKASDITGKSSYLTTEFGTIDGNLQYKSDFGSLKIVELSEDAKNIQIKSGYTNIKIGYAPRYSASFNIQLDYASLKTEGNVSFNIKKEEHNKKYYEGTIGSKNSGNKLLIDSNYGGVKLIKN
ncbi:hypothetical protein [Leptobacterium sp. I13]|uniref:hypothetical protein n=1 Tax=Leptobacterium meishanense TaxID=3128904 RepID=UPI0030EF4350